MKKIICLLTLTTAVGCQYNKKEAIREVCSTANITYTGSVASIIRDNGCLGCHTGTPPQGGFRLETYDEVKARAAQLRSGTSVLLGALQHQAGFSPMPKGMTRLSDCDLSKLKAWVDAGMPQ